MDGEDALENVEQMREVVKLERFVNYFPVEIHRWVVGNHPKLLGDAGRLADKFGVLYKLYKMEHAQHQTLSVLQINSLK